jgi:hypothetical protein
VDERLGDVEEKLGEVDERLGAVEGRLDTLATEGMSSFLHLHYANITLVQSIKTLLLQVLTQFGVTTSDSPAD